MALPKLGEKKNCETLFVAMSLPKQGEKNNFCFGNCGNGIAENAKKKKNCFGNCGNVTAENGKKKFVLAIVVMALPKIGKKKCYEICERVKKKLSRLQYFYNIFTINHT